MGTQVHQHVHGLDAASCCAAARDEIVRLEQLWSVFLPNSEISELARRAGSTALSVASDTAAILRLARELHDLTRGAFDVTAGPLIELWRAAARRGIEPTEKALGEALALVNAGDIELIEPQTVRLRRHGQRLDLGAIGKGYAADRCIELYRARGIRHAFIDLGGNVAVLGGKPDGTPWRVGLQTPGRERGECFGWVDVCDASLVTSGNYERGYEFGARRYSHILDPRTGSPLPDDLRSVSVLHASSALADAFATALIVMDTQSAFEFASDFGLAAVLFDAGTIRLSPAMAHCFRSASSRAAVVE